MATYETIQQLIEQNRDILNFGPFGNGASDENISRAQLRLQVQFPPSYIWWLKNYRGGEIFGDEIYSVYSPNLDDIPGGDIIYMNELNRRENLSDIFQLIIQENDHGQIFYFDLRMVNSIGEYPVYRAFGDLKEQYANNFLEFLEKRIKDEY